MYLFTYKPDKNYFIFQRMTLLIISLLLLVCTINGQGTDSLNPIAIVPLNQTPTIDLPSPQELDAGMAALNRSQTPRSSGTQADEQKFMGNKQASVFSYFFLKRSIIPVLRGRG